MSYIGAMKIITQREFRNNSAGVMNAVEAGETYHITRNGTEVAELRPLSRKRRLTARELVEKHSMLPEVNYPQMRGEADEFFGDQDQLSDSDLLKRDRGQR